MDPFLHIDYGPDTDEEIRLKKQLFDLRCEFEEKAAPILKRLADIHALKAPRYVVAVCREPS
ncbi:hypothetical protein OOJ09_12750 [Mesorhizobium qingshengii]|uniref:Uncharacterized protein n=1 Tax=Mesorhizobium qingshengii TaxID=1165689 RepID=A0ABT4QTZ5_9HYPH|nr:hypothetical protein [Mesorhizobium qingshengii]MCZ8545055.1 hypothetical protein [Mesorhizobium qingshengii]